MSRPDDVKRVRVCMLRSPGTEVVCLAELLAEVRAETFEATQKACAQIRDEAEGEGPFAEGKEDGGERCLRAIRALAKESA